MENPSVSRRFHTRWLLIGLAAGIVTVAVVALAAGGSSTKADQADAASTVAAATGSNAGVHSCESGAPPDNYAVELRGEPISLDQAQALPGFDLLIPDVPVANPENLKGAYALAGSVELRFPRPTASSSDLRQPCISIDESQWRGGEPLNAFKNDLQASPDVGKSICSAGDLVALCVKPRSPSDEMRSNPAYVRVVVGDTELELSGGDSVETLLEAAESLQ